MATARTMVPSPIYQRSGKAAMVKRWPGYFFNITSCILHSHHVVAQQNDVHRFPLWKILNWRMAERFGVLLLLGID